MTTDERFEAIVVGSGPAGSIAAMELANRGLDVLLIEREQFPRYHIGESLTASSAIVLRELGLGPMLEQLQFPVKTGVKVVGRGARSSFFVPVLEPTWQVRRAELDQLLSDHAVRCGATLRRGVVESVLREGERVCGVEYRSDDGGPVQRRSVGSKVVVDATGQTTLLSRLGVASPRVVDDFGRQIALFSQFRGATRDAGAMGDNTLIFYGDPDHWGWFIPLSPDVVSVGVVMPVETYKRHGETADAVYRWGLRNINPDLCRRVEGSDPIEPTRVIRNYSYSVDRFAGEGWVCVGDAHRFVDPIFSFGVSFAMTEARRAAEAIERALCTGEWAEPMAEYQALCTRGQDAAADLIRYFWRFPAFFSYLSQGELRGQLIQLFSGNFFHGEELEVLRRMRESLGRVPASPPRAFGRHQRVGEPTMEAGLE